MSRYEGSVWCDGCGVEILWSPVIEAGRDYCCQECARGEECDCGERMELVDDHETQTPGQPAGEWGVYG